MVHRNLKDRRKGGRGWREAAECPTEVTWKRLLLMGVHYGRTIRGRKRPVKVLDQRYRQAQGILRNSWDLVQPKSDPEVWSRERTGCGRDRKSQREATLGPAFQPESLL